MSPKREIAHIQKFLKLFSEKKWKKKHNKRHLNYESKNQRLQKGSPRVIENKFRYLRRKETH